MKAKKEKTFSQPKALSAKEIRAIAGGAAPVKGGPSKGNPGKTH